MKRKQNVTVLAAAAGMGLLSLRSAAVTAGAKQGLTLCADVLIPATFPFMVLSAVGAAGVGTVGSKKRGSRLFNRAGGGLPIFLLSLMGGYPVGAAMASQCVAAGRITSAEGRGLCCICFNAGPAFVIGAVGAAMLGSPATGAVLFGCLALAAVITALLLGAPKGKSGAGQGDFTAEVPLAALITEGVKQGSEGMLKVAAWVILFGALQGLLPQGINQTAQGLLLCFFEISGGMASAVKWLPLPATAAFLSFGGVCTHCQVMSLARNTGLSYCRFLGARCLQAGVAALTAAVAFRLFPAAAAVTTAAGTPTPVAFYGGIPTAISLLFMCVIFVLGLDIKEKV